MSDRLTILRSRGLPLAKTWRSDGSIESYSKAKNFVPEVREVDGIDTLSALLQDLEGKPNACVIRGAPKHPNQPEMRRLIENVDDVPLHAVLIEVDDYRPVINDSLTETQEAALEYVAECLPELFQGASFHWQASNSMGAPGKEGLLKAHLWFWLHTPYDLATLRAWATSIDLAADKTVLNPVQIHYTSAPIFESGRIDPVPRRSGFFQGSRDSVDLKIDTASLDIRHQGERLRGERRNVDDPLADWIETSWETHGALSNGGIVVDCPFEDGHHSGAKGDTSTVYFPAGTNSYAEGRWVCKHDSCHTRSQAEFSNKAGYSPLAALAVPEKANGHLNGHTVELPWMRRDAKGAIEPIFENLHIAAGCVQLAGMELQYDAFRGEIVAIEPNADDWRGFTDDDYGRIRLKLEKGGFKPINKGDLRDAIHLVAADNQFDTAVSWISGLKWDGIPRIRVVLHQPVRRRERQRRLRASLRALHMDGAGRPGAGPRRAGRHGAGADRRAGLPEIDRGGGAVACGQVRHHHVVPRAGGRAGAEDARHAGRRACRAAGTEE